MAKRYHAIIFKPGDQIPEIVNLTNATLAHKAALEQGRGGHTRPTGAGNGVGQAVCKVYSGHPDTPPTDVAMITREHGDPFYTVTSLKDIEVQIEIPASSVKYAIPLPPEPKKGPKP